MILWAFPLPIACGRTAFLLYWRILNDAALLLDYYAPFWPFSGCFLIFGSVGPFSELLFLLFWLAIGPIWPILGCIFIILAHFGYFWLAGEL